MLSFLQKMIDHVLQIRVLQIRVLQIRVLQIGVLQIHFLQIRVLQIRVLQIQSVFYKSNPVHVLQYAGIFNMRALQIDFPPIPRVHTFLSHCLFKFSFHV